MAQIKFISTTVLAILMFGGCSNNQPPFDSKDTQVRVVDGKSYNIPKGANPSPYVDAKVIKFYQSLGLNECKTGDITWEDTNAKDEMNVAIGNGDKDVYRKLAKKRRIGCASPLSK